MLEITLRTVTGIIVSFLTGKASLYFGGSDFLSGWLSLLGYFAALTAFNKIQDIKSKRRDEKAD